MAQCQAAPPTCPVTKHKLLTERARTPKSKDQPTQRKRRELIETILNNRGQKSGGRLVIKEKWHALFPVQD